MHFLPYPIPIIGTVAALVLGWLIISIGHGIISRRSQSPKESYRKNRLLNTVVIVIVLVAIAVLWAKVIPKKETFFGLLGAGMAVALREPLLSIAGRIAIFAGHMYTAGDRIEINKLSGDVIDVGFFYTRMMEIGNWVGGDQYSGRIIQFANAQVFGTPVFNYTRNFAYIWDEIKIPITYDSNLDAATEILKSVGGEYTREFLKGAEAQVRQMERIFMVPRFEIEPAVYLKVTDNWLELTLRYLVDPKRRRNASTFMFSEVFRRIHQRQDIKIASSTMDLTVHGAEMKTSSLGQQDKAA
jgi:small-conductance mechanosensitive channel